MKARDIVGKRVVAIKQTMRRRQDSDRYRPVGMELDAILFDDGSELRFSVAELGYDYAVLPVFIKKAES